MAIIMEDVGVGVELVSLTADAAYDTVNNWVAAEELSVEFIPNMRGILQE